MNTEIESLRLANEIRNLGFNVEIEMNNRKFKKSMDYANREKIPYVIVLGEDEISKNSFNINIYARHFIFTNECYHFLIFDIFVIRVFKHCFYF